MCRSTRRIVLGSRATVVAVVALLTVLASARADITWSGDVDPDDPSTWTDRTRGYVGYSAEGALTIANDSDLLTQASWIGFGKGSSGVVHVHGTGSTWDNESSLRIGQAGDALLRISDGGFVTSAYSVIAEAGSATATVEVTGEDTEWRTGPLFVGDEGNGQLNIENGASVSTRDATSIGNTVTGSGRVLVSGTGSTLDAPLSVGSEGTGILIVESGGRVDSFGATIGSQETSAGIAVIAGINSTWGINRDLIVGLGGNGRLRIRDGAIVSSGYGGVGLAPSATGIVIVDGVGSAWNMPRDLSIGEHGTGSLTIENGGEVTSATGNLGSDRTGGDGSVTVRGEGSRWTIGWSLIIGREGRGSLTILDGGSVVNSLGGEIRIGNLARQESSGIVRVSGIGSSLTNDGDLWIESGSNVPASLTVEDGGSVTNGNAVIQNTTVTVDGPGSHWTSSGPLYVDQFGFLGSSTLSVTNGGTISNTDATLRGIQSTRITVDGPGSTWTNSGDLIAEWGPLSIVIANGGHLASRQGHIARRTRGPRVTVTGPGSSWVSQEYISVYDDGIVEVGNGGLITSIDESYGGIFLGNESILAIHIGPHGPGSLAAPRIGAHATLNLTLDHGIPLAIGDEFPIATFGTRSGEFAYESLLSFVGDEIFEWAVNYNPNDITLEVVSSRSRMPGDFDGDEDVDLDDHAAWRAAFGTTGFAMGADGNADGRVDAADYAIWRDHYVYVPPPRSLLGPAIPEPSTLLLTLGLAGGLLATWRQRAARG